MTSPPPSRSICRLHPVRADRTACGAAPLQQARALLLCAATPRSCTGVPSLPLRQRHDVKAISSEQLAELVPSRRRLPSSSQSCDGRRDKYLPSLHYPSPPSTSSSISSQPQTLATALICSLLPSTSSASRDQNVGICGLRIFFVLSPLSYGPNLCCFCSQFCLNLICNFFDSCLGLICNFSM